MRVLVLGAGAYPADIVAAELGARGHSVVAPPDRASALRECREAAYDVVADPGARGAADVRAAVAALAGRAAHYVLVSSHRVYPAVPRLRPWRPADIDLGDEPGLPTLPAEVLGLRAAERELRLGARDLAWTVLRPSVVEDASDPSGRLSWYASRILEGGPLILPDDPPHPWRCVAAADLAQAVVAVAGRERARREIFNVTGQGLLTPFGLALALMDALERRVPVAWVPGWRWRAAGLPEPGFGAGPSALLESSPGLRALGWRPEDETRRLKNLAREAAAAPRRGDAALRATERRVLRESELAGEYSFEPGHGPRRAAPNGHWMLLASPGQPASLRLERSASAPRLAPPLLRVRRFAPGDSFDRLLTGAASAEAQPRVPGTCALLEVEDPGAGNLARGALFLPVSQLPCADAACAFCAGVARTTGIDCDGYAAARVTTPESHLVQVPETLAPFALLAEPLARVARVLEPLLAETTGPVWILGRRAEALLAAWLAADAERSVVHLDRTLAGDTAVPGGARLHDLRAMREAVAKKQAEAPGVALNLSGAREGENLLAMSLPRGAPLVSPFPPPANLAPHGGRPVALPAGTDRKGLERALARLAAWSSTRDLASLVGPGVAPELFWDALLPGHFRQPFVDAEGR